MRGTGSGEVIRSDGYILTNNHVISVAAQGGSVEVLFSDGQSSPATITGRDPQTDLAVPEGLFVQAVTPGGPAATAGLRADDVITTIDGQPATSNIQLQELTLTKKPGDEVSVGYARAGQPATATITLGAQP
jgi:S1-C subfamily serine protease